MVTGSMLEQIYVPCQTQLAPQRLGSYLCRFLQVDLSGSHEHYLGGLLGSQPIQNETGEAWGPDISAQVRRKLRLNK